MSETDPATNAMLPCPPDPKAFLTSKLFWTGALTFVASIAGHFSPPLGQFLRDNSLVIGGALGPLIVGLRTVTSQPMTFDISKVF